MLVGVFQSLCAAAHTQRDLSAAQARPIDPNWCWLLLDSRKLDSRLPVVAVAMQRAWLCAERARETHNHESLIYAIINAIGASDLCQEQATRARSRPSGVEPPTPTSPHTTRPQNMPSRAAPAVVN